MVKNHQIRTILLCAVFSTLVFSCVTKTPGTPASRPVANQVAASQVAARPELKINEIKEKIIENISGGIALDTGIDIAGIRAFMKNYKAQENSHIVRVNDTPHDLLVIEKFLSAVAEIRTHWDSIKRKHIQQVVTESVSAKIHRNETDEYLLLDTLSHFYHQSEIAAIFFPLLLESFQLTNVQYRINSLPEAAIPDLTLPMTAISIDGIPYDALAVETLSLLMSRKSTELVQSICYELTTDINKQFDICVSNVDSYLDWYYGYITGFAKLGVLIKGAVSPKETAGEALQEHSIKKYVEKIGAGVSFNNVIVALEQYRKQTIDQAFVFAYVLEDCIIEFNGRAKSIGGITGDDYMLPLAAVSNYLNTVILEGLPILGMGTVLDNEGLPLLDLANLVVNFLPGVGLVAGTILDVATLKLTEHLKRPDFRMQIITSIRDDQKKLLRVIKNTNPGGVR